MSFSFALNLLKFEDVRNQIVEYLKENSEFSAQFDFTASNISLIIDSMAYVSMLMSYQLSNVANNLFLDTTIIRKNAISIAKTMGYRPKRVYSSKVFGSIQYVDDTQVFSANSSIKIPAQSIFISDKGYQFINYDDIVLTVSDTDPSMLTADLILTEGIIKTYSYLGNGQPFQKFTIPSKKVEENNFNLYVRSNTNSTGTKWEEVKQSFNLLDKNSYFIEEDIETEGYINVLFGDGNVTYYPESSDIVDIYYLESNATNANGSVIQTIPTIISGNVSAVPSFSVNNFVSISTTTGTSYGGKELETIAEIQANAPKSFAAVGRAVTQNDYKTLLTQYAYIYKSNAIGGDTLYPDEFEKLGNIYISCIPIDTNIFDLYSNDILYLNNTEELALRYEIDKYRIISTQLNFLKPSYIQVSLTPRVETRNNLNAYEIEQLKGNITITLEDFIKNNYNDYGISFRTSRFNGEINNVQNVLSSDIDCTYSFAITNESFYNPNDNDNSSIFLPIKIKSKNSFGVITGYESFVQTNQEKMTILSKTSLDISDSTIYGTITGDSVTRYIYNVDNIPISGTIETCKIMIDGRNDFITFYRFANNDSNISFTHDGVTTIFNNDVVSGDSYKITFNGVELGTLYRTMNVSGGFKGIAESQSNISSNTTGDFYQIVYEFEVSGMPEPNTVVKGDYIIYDGVNWIKATPCGTISATTDEGLFPKISHNDVYEIGVAGNFGGYTSSVTAGDYIIFNLYSTLNPTHKWEKINFISNPPLSADLVLPPEVVDYELKRVILDSGTTNFNNGLSSSVSGDSLIFYNASLTVIPEANRWQDLGSVAPSAIATSFPTTIDAQPLTGCTLDTFNYTTLTIGTKLRTVGIGNFGLTEQSIANKIKINWATIEDSAYDDDILVYIGKHGVDQNPTWNIWQEGVPQVFNIDGNVPTALPKKLAYGDMLTVSGSGNFDGQTDFIAEDGDYIIYVGDNQWILENAPATLLDASSTSGLPLEAAIGDYFKISEDGNFEMSYLISPSGQNFVQGDYIIFNGTDYVFLNEYSFTYTNSPDAREYLNSVGFNSTYNYDYNLQSRSYNLYFNDQFTGQQIGEFRYDSSDEVQASLFSVGKLTFTPYVTGKYNEIEATGNVQVKSLFNNTINKISFQPKHKKDVYGNISQDVEQNFDTTFNMVTTITVEDTVIEL